MKRAAAATIARAEVPQVVRVVVASAVAWQLCEVLGADEPPIYGVLVPLVAMRDEPFSTFNVSLARLAGVVVGVLIGVAVLDLRRPDVVAVSALLGVALLVGMAMRIGGTLNTQVAVSALLVFATGNPSGYAWHRLWETAVGALVTVVLSPLLFPANAYTDVRSRLGQIGHDLERVLVALAHRIGGDASAEVSAVDAVAARAAQLEADVAKARRAMRVNPIQRRHLPALVALQPRVTVASAVATQVQAFAGEVVDLAGHDHGGDLQRQRQPITAIAEPLGAAIHGAIEGVPDAVDLQRAHAAFDADRARNTATVDVVLRHPLRRMLTVLDDATSPGGASMRG